VPSGTSRPCFRTIRPVREAAATTSHPARRIGVDRNPHGLARRIAATLALVVVALSCARRADTRADAVPPPTDRETTLDAQDAPPALEAAPADVTAEPDEAEGPEDAATDEAAGDDALDAPAPAEDPAALESACRKGDLAACLRAANVYAEGFSGDDADEERARTLWGRACERKHPEGCRLQAESLLAGGSASRDGRRAMRLLDRACELGSLVACTGLAGRYLRGDGVRADVYQSLLRFQRACNGGYAGACVEMQSARGLAETFDLPLPRPRDPAAPQHQPAAETVCPPVFRRAAASGGESLDHGLRGLPVAELVSAFPGRAAGDWVCTVGGSPAGVPGAGQVGVDGTCRNAGGASVDVVLRDWYLECTLQPGTGAAMLAAVLPGDGEHAALRVGGVDAVLIESTPSPHVRLWLADRCELVLTAGNEATAEDLRTVATGALDLPALGRICARREGEGLPTE